MGRFTSSLARFGTLGRTNPLARTEGHGKLTGRPRRPQLLVEPLEPRTLLSSNPVANDDFADTDGQNVVRIAVLHNDSAQAGLNPQTVRIVSLPQHGSIQAVDFMTGDVFYRSGSPSFAGTDTFSYTVLDNNGAISNVARVTVVVNRPTANDDAADTDAGNPVVIDVLGNDTDLDGRGALVPGSVTVTGFPAHGRVLVDPATGQLTYTAFAGFFGVDQFTYTVADVHGSRSSPATVTVSVAHGPLPVVSRGAGGRLRILDPQTGGLLLVLRPYGRHFHGKLRVALGDVNGDGIADVIIGAAHGRRPLRLFNGQTGALLGTFPAPGTRKTDGVHVAAGDVNGDGVADVLLLSRRRGHSLALAFSGVNGAPLGALTPAQIDRFFAST
jgi:Bacterial Ig domain/FG-GAP-like repeat